MGTQPALNEGEAEQRSRRLRPDLERSTKFGLRLGRVAGMDVQMTEVEGCQVGARLRRCHPGEEMILVAPIEVPERRQARAAHEEADREDRRGGAQGRGTRPRRGPHSGARPPQEPRPRDRRDVEESLRDLGHASGHERASWQEGQDEPCGEERRDPGAPSAPHERDREQREHDDGRNRLARQRLIGEPIRGSRVRDEQQSQILAERVHGNQSPRAGRCPIERRADRRSEHDPAKSQIRRGRGEIGPGRRCESAEEGATGRALDGDARLDRRELIGDENCVQREGRLFAEQRRHEQGETSRRHPASSSPASHEEREGADQKGAGEHVRPARDERDGLGVDGMQGEHDSRDDRRRGAAEQ